MNFDAFVKIASLAVTVVSYVVYRILNERCVLKYKEQKVGGRK